MTSGLANKQYKNPTKEDGAERSRHKLASTAEFELVQRILATAAFVRSVHLTRFLRYICDCKFNGRENEITEYQIGVQALGRGESYNPGDDNIVRNYARILRKRLDEYFADEGRDESMHIVIPVGHYIPVFEPRLAANGAITANGQNLGNPDTAPKFAPVAVVPRTPHWRRLRWTLIPTLALVIAGIAMSIGLKYRARSANIDDLFWRQIFDHNHVTYLVPGDSGLAMMQEITGKEIHLSDYIAGDLDEKFQEFNLAAARGGAEYGFDRVSNFTSKADLSIASGVAKLAQLYGGQLKVCYSRYMNMENFRDSNVILVGGPRANPWVELFEPESNFRMDFPMHADGIHFDERNFINKHPRAGEQATYANQVDNNSNRAYALISYLPEENGSGHALLLEGQGMAGTQAAGDFLLDPHQIEPILRKAQNPDGSIGAFEVLMEARTVGENEAQINIVVERVGITKAVQ